MVFSPWALDKVSTHQQRRSRKRDLLKRVMSSSHQRSNTVEVSDSERNTNPFGKDTKSIVSEIRKNFFLH